MILISVEFSFSCYQNIYCCRFFPVKIIFNRREGQQSSVSTRTCTELPPNNEDRVDHKEIGGRVNSPKPSEDKSNAPQKGNTVRNSHLSDRDDGDEMSNRPFKKPKFEKGDNDQELNIQSGDIPSQKSDGDKEPNLHLNVSNDLVYKPLKVGTDASDVQIKGKSILGKDSNEIVEAVLPVKRKLDEEVQRAVNIKRPKVSDHTLNKESSPSRGFTEVTRKPDAVSLHGC